MRSLRYLLIPVLAAIVCAVSCATVRAQVPGLAAPTATPKQSLFATQPIAIDGTVVLHVTALASPPPGALPIETRVFLINGAIAQLLAMDPETNETIYDPKTLKIAVSQSGGEYVLAATDERHRSPLPILTVTSDDARHANLSASDLAAQWQTGLQQMLTSALERRQPAEIHRNTTLIVVGAVVLVLLTLATAIIVWLRPEGRTAAAAPWVLALVWFAAIDYALMLFPQTVAAGHVIMRMGIRVAIIWTVALLVERLLSFATRHTVRSWATFGITPEKRGRSLLRVPTMSKALVGFERTVIVFTAALLTLSALNVPVASVITIGGVAALAIGFAAQSLVRDFLNGLLVLLEDQYVVGDYIAIGAFNGIVEELTLRVVQLRDSTGSLITIPHSTVSQVVNSSRNWSRVDYRITIAPSADLRKAFEIARSTVEALKGDEAWRDDVIVPIEWIGVESISAGGTTVRFVTRTAPLRQFQLRREINLRISDAFKKAGIVLGSDTAPAVVMQTAASPSPS
jgi:moderate conductance mechanosensitive channel